MFVHDDGRYLLTSYGVMTEERLVTEVENLLAD